MTKKSNDELRAVYEKAYEGNKSYASEKGSFFTFSTEDITAFILERCDFQGKDVLEIGCGTGETASAIAKAGARAVRAVDYSSEVIKTCSERHKMANLHFACSSIDKESGKHDMIVMQEVIEHVDYPEQVILKLVSQLTPGGKLILTCPNFTNIRGHIWMTLQLLFEVPMSLSDLHFFSPFDMQEIAARNQLKLEWTTFAHDRVTGEKLVFDMQKRLTNALRDAKMDNSRVEKCLMWFEKASLLEKANATNYNGGKGYYEFSR